MDSYAVISSDLKCASEKMPTSLQNIGVVPAGDGPDKKITPGCCMRIFTGSPIPEGANAVVMQEGCEINTNENRVLCATKLSPGKHPDERRTFKPGSNCLRRDKKSTQEHSDSWRQPAITKSKLAASRMWESFRPVTNWSKRQKN